MICSASLSLLSLAFTLGHADTVPVPFAERVRVAVAARWAVDTADLQLQWTAIAHAEEIAADTPFHLTGRGDDGWLVVVAEPAHLAPRAMRVRAGVSRDIPVAAHALRTGQQIALKDMTTRRDIIWSAGAAAANTSAVGWEARHDLAEGAPLIGNAVIAPRVITAGQMVVFYWSSHGVRVERLAVASAPARLGETVQAQAGGTKLTGRATGPGTAQMKENNP